MNARHAIPPLPLVWVVPCAFLIVSVLGCSESHLNPLRGLAMDGDLDGSSTDGGMDGSGDSAIDAPDADGGGGGIRPTHSWYKEITGADADQASPIVRSLDLDAQGNLWATGQVAGASPEITRGGPGGIGDVFVAKLEPSDGTISSAVRYGSPQHDVGLSILWDPAGRIYVAGQAGPVTFEGQAPPPAVDALDAFVVALDAAGLVPLWARWGAANRWAASNALSMVGGTPAVGTNFDYQLDVAGSILTAEGSGGCRFDNLVSLLSPADGLVVGGREWQYGGSFYDVMIDVTGTDDGGFVLVGSTGGDMVLGSMTVPTPTDECAGETDGLDPGCTRGTYDCEVCRDIVVARVASNGDAMWTRSFGGFGSSQLNAVRVGPDGHIYAAGRIRDGPIRMGTECVGGVGGRALLAVSFSIDGDLRWARSLGGPTGTATSRALAVVDGLVLVAGDFDGTLDFGGQELPSEGGRDALLVAYDTDGRARWAYSWPGVDDDSFYAVAARDARGPYYAAGYGAGTHVGNEITSQGGRGLIVRLDPP